MSRSSLVPLLLASLLLAACDSGGNLIGNGTGTTSSTGGTGTTSTNTGTTSTTGSSPFGNTGTGTGTTTNNGTGTTSNTGTGTTTNNGTGTTSNTGTGTTGNTGTGSGSTSDNGTGTGTTTNNGTGTTGNNGTGTTSSNGTSNCSCPSNSSSTTTNSNGTTSCPVTSSGSGSTGTGSGSTSGSATCTCTTSNGTTTCTTSSAAPASPAKTAADTDTATGAGAPVDPGALCLTTACGHKQTLLDLPAAASLLFAPNGRLFATGSGGVFEVTRDAQGTLHLVTLRAGGAVSGLSLVGDMLYVADASSQQLLGARLDRPEKMAFKLVRGQASAPTPLAGGAAPAPSAVRVAGGALLFADAETGQVTLTGLDGQVLSQSAPAAFLRPSSALLGRPPMFSATDILVVEQGAAGAEGTGEALSVFRHDR